jgi:hypothetical protein
MRLGERFGVRLDSGNLAELAAGARHLLDAAGLPGARIVASGGLDEYDIEHLVRAGAPIDAYGIGTKMGSPRTRRRWTAHTRARRLRRPAGHEAVSRQGNLAQRQTGLARHHDRRRCHWRAYGTATGRP